MGFKAWNLLRMARLSLPVPAAFVIGTRDRADPAARAGRAGADLWRAGLRVLERSTGQALGDARRPLLLSVRSGAPVSMPGMMDTLLNIGLRHATVGGLLRQTGNPRLCGTPTGVWWPLMARSWPACRLAFSMTPPPRCSGAATNVNWTSPIFVWLTQRSLEVFQGRGATVPAGSRRAARRRHRGRLFASWQSPRAREYPRLNIADDIGPR